MAIVINPDGTVSTIETTHDQYGNLRPKIVNPDAGSGPHVAPSGSGLTYSEWLHNNKGKKKKGVTMTSSPDSLNVPKPKSMLTYKGKRRAFRAMFLSTLEIDQYFEKRRENLHSMSQEDFHNMAQLTPSSLVPYFKKKYLEYVEYYNRFQPKDSRKRKKSKKKAKIKAELKRSRRIERLGRTVAETAQKVKYASSQDFEVRTSEPPRPARAPKYAYARDRYGRVQERDSYNEERRNEFHQAQSRQRHYDYSSYDANDDNDGAYSEWE